MVLPTLDLTEEYNIGTLETGAVIFTQDVSPPQHQNEDYTVEKIKPSLEPGWDYIGTAYGALITSISVIILFLSFLGPVKLGIIEPNVQRISASLIAAVYLLKYPHERIHSYVGKYFGYSSKIQYTVFGGQTIFCDQWLGAYHRAVIIISPLLVISPISFVLAHLMSGTTLAYFFVGIFASNNFGSFMSDVFNAVETFSHGPRAEIRIPKEDDNNCIWIAKPERDS